MTISTPGDDGMNWLPDEGGEPRAPADIDWLESDRLGDEAEGGHPPQAIATVDCWRCGKAAPAVLSRCPACRATLNRHEQSYRPAPSLDPNLGSGISRVLYVYLALLATSVVYGWTIHFELFAKPPTEEEVRADLGKMAVVEVIDAALILGGLAWAGRPRPLPSVSDHTRRSGWLLATPTLFALLALNYVYHGVLRDMIGLKPVENIWVHKPGLVPWFVLLYCVQPAIFEELFCRYLVLGHLRALLGTHSAVWMQGVMFGLLHIFQVAGMPYLIVVGVVLGYARVYSRTLAVPVLMHAAHNAIVTWCEPWL